MSNDNIFQISLYMDDLQLSYRCPNREFAERKLQDSKITVEKFAQKNDFKCSTSKTSMINFTELSTPPPIGLQLDSITIQKSETVKYLGLVFDS